MKNWFINLEEKYKAIIHVILGLILIIIPSLVKNNINTFVSLIWTAILVLEIVFIVWQVKYKVPINDEENENQSKTNESKQETNWYAKSNNTLKREHFELSITTRDYSNDRIKAVVKEYISEEFFDKDEIYEGLTNSEIEQCGYEVYQLNQPTFSANIRDFEDSDSFGVYLRDYNDNEIYIGTISKDNVNDVRKVLIFGNNIECYVSLEGGKYKEYDYDKEKVVIKDSEYLPTLNLSCNFPDFAESKMKELLLQEQGEKNSYKIYYSKIVGITFDNEDGKNRKNIIDKLNFNEKLRLEKYFYNNEKAVKVLTQNCETIGNIPRELSVEIYDLLENNEIKKIYFYPTKDKEKICVYRLKYLISKK